MKNRKLFLIPTVLLALSISACSVKFNISSKEDNTSQKSSESSLESASTSKITSTSQKTSTSNAPSSSSSMKSSSSSSSKQSSSSSSSSEAPIVDNSGFKNINDTQTFEIHTSAQKTYLSYQGDYSQMPENQYPDGSTHQSDSNPITLTWNYTAKSGKTVSKFSVIFGQESDLSDGYQVDGTTSNAISFYNPYLGRNYYKLIATYTDNTKDETPIRHFEVDSTYPRNLTIGGMTNCRDMGGRVLEDGGRFKQGLIFRTSGKKYDYIRKTPRCSGGCSTPIPQ